jgi:hypothetical protein
MGKKIPGLKDEITTAVANLVATAQSKKDCQDHL